MMSSNSEDIKENVEIGRSIREIVNLAMSEAVPFRNRKRFWRTLVDQLIAVGGLVDEPPTGRIEDRPMTEEEARGFGRIRMTFGKHEGVEIRNVPLDYLEWLVDQHSSFRTNLKRYLKADNIKREREQCEQQKQTSEAD